MATPPILSGGNFCLTAEMTKRHGLRSGAGPFDWLFCPVRDLIAILDDDFRHFLDRRHYQSISNESGRPSCLHAMYGGGVDRPLFNHKDPTTSADHLYYDQAVRRFRDQAADHAVLFVIDEGDEIEQMFDDLVKVIKARFPSLVVRALRHRVSSQAASLSLLRSGGQHQLWLADASPVVGGVKLREPWDEELIVGALLRSDKG